jgi:uncharacterized membrane protein YesL
MNQFTYLAATRIWQLTAINLTALALVFLGGVAAGIAPAGAAVLHAVHRLDDLSAGQLVRAMWGTYRTEFIRANMVGLPIVGIAVVLIWVGPSLGIFGFGVSMFLVVIALCLAAASLLIVAHIAAGVVDTWHNARMALLLSPYGHLVSFLALGPWFWLIWQQPLIGLYVGFSVPAYVYSGLVLPSVCAGFPASNKPISQQEALT